MYEQSDHDDIYAWHERNNQVSTKTSITCHGKRPKERFISKRSELLP